MRRNRLVTTLAAVALSVALVGCGAGGKDEAAENTTTTKPQVTAKMSIYKIATLDGQFGQFLDLAKRAGLNETLEKEGPFTLFAPNSATIIKLGKAKIDSLKADKAGLKALLEDHLVAGDLTLAAIAALNGKSLTSVGGSELPVKVKGNAVTVGGAKIVKSDIDADNGMVFVMDGIVTPKG